MQQRGAVGGAAASQALPPALCPSPLGPCSPLPRAVLPCGSSRSFWCRLSPSSRRRSSSTLPSKAALQVRGVGQLRSGWAAAAAGPGSTAGTLAVWARLCSAKLCGWLPSSLLSDHSVCPGSPLPAAEGMEWGQQQVRQPPRQPAAAA